MNRTSPLALAASENFSRIDRISNLRPLPLVAVREPVLLHEPKSAPVDSGCSWLFGTWDNSHSPGMNSDVSEVFWADSGRLMTPRSGSPKRRQTEPWSPMSSTPRSRGLTPESRGLSSSSEEGRPSLHEMGSSRNAGIDSMRLPSLTPSKTKNRPSKSMLFLVSDDNDTDMYMKRCCREGRRRSATQHRFRAVSTAAMASVRMQNMA